METQVAVPENGGGRKCTRCGRSLKRAYMVGGAAYGPVCVRKLGFVITSDGRATRKLKEETPENDGHQLMFFVSDTHVGDIAQSRHAKFEIVENLPDRLVIRDLNGGMSITNDAEWVVEQLVDESFPGPKNRRLFYYDSVGDLDELVIVMGKFYAFEPGPGRKARA